MCFNVFFQGNLRLDDYQQRWLTGGRQVVEGKKGSGVFSETNWQLWCMPIQRFPNHRQLCMYVYFLQVLLCACMLVSKAGVWRWGELNHKGGDPLRAPKRGPPREKLLASICTEALSVSVWKNTKAKASVSILIAS